MPRSTPRGRLVIPDPALELAVPGIHAQVGASLTHCEVQTLAGDSYTCRSAGDALADKVRHETRGGDIQACATCEPTRPATALQSTPPQLDRMATATLAAELADRLARRQQQTPATRAAIPALLAAMPDLVGQ